MDIEEYAASIHLGSPKNSKEQLSISICMPIYKASALLDQSLGSIFRQRDFTNFKVLIGDNTPSEMREEVEKTEAIIQRYDASRIEYVRNETNLGYPGNLQRIVSRAQGDILFLMAHDDVLASNALRLTHDAFLMDDDVGAVARPYFWFFGDLRKPVRLVTPLDPERDRLVRASDSQATFDKIFEALGQLSGLAYRRKFLEVPFHDEVFPCHIYPFAGILRKHRCVFLKDYTVAVRVETSQTRSISSIYDRSPTESWIDMFKSVYSGVEYGQLRQWGIDLISRHFEGLVQLKAYANKGVLEREIKLLVSNRPSNLINPKFWAFFFLTTLTPRTILAHAADWHKKRAAKQANYRVEFNV